MRFTAKSDADKARRIIPAGINGMRIAAAQFVFRANSPTETDCSLPLLVFSAIECTIGIKNRMNPHQITDERIVSDINKSIDERRATAFPSRQLNIEKIATAQPAALEDFIFAKILK